MDTPRQYGRITEKREVRQHYAEAFGTSLGECFRMVSSAVPGARGAPHRCPLPVAMRGVFKDSRGIEHEVDACLDHSGHLAWWEPVEQ